MSQQWWKDDDQLLAALGEALRSGRKPIAAEGADRSGRHTKNETVRAAPLASSARPIPRIRRILARWAQTGADHSV